MKRNVELEVHGMSCAGCTKSVSRIIGSRLDIEPDKVDVSLEDARARFKADVDDEQLAKICEVLTTQGFQSSVA